MNSKYWYFQATEKLKNAERPVYGGKNGKEVDLSR